MLLLSIVALAAPAGAGALFVAGLDAALLAACVFEWLRTPSPRVLTIERRLPERAGLSQDFARRLRVRAGRAAGLRLQVRECFPSDFDVVRVAAADEVPGRARLSDPRADDPTAGPDEVRLAGADEWVEVPREYRSRRRGEHVLGDVRLRLFGPLGLFARQSYVRGEQRIAIEPALLELAATLRLAASERWRELGIRRLLRRGGMTEFESLRDYVHGDDLRTLDWKATARRGRPTVRQFQQERGQELVIAIDAGRRMGATTAGGDQRGWTKLDFALDAALELAAVALQEGDRVGILVFDAQPRRWVAPGRGRGQLAKLREAVFAEQPSALDSDLGRALRAAALRLRRRALLLILSDVADPLSVRAQRRALAQGASRHRVVFAALDDPGLRALAERRAPGSAALRAASCAEVEDRANALVELGGAGRRVLNPLPAETAGALLGAWLDERRRA